MIEVTTYSSIDEIPVPFESLYKRGGYRAKLDPGIDKLVRVLNSLDVTTYGSCEGHLDPENLEFRRHPFPWITTHHNYIDFRGNFLRFREILESYNRERNVHWKVSDGLRTKDGASNPEELLLLQKSADDLASYLFELFHSSTKKII